MRPAAVLVLAAATAVATGLAGCSARSDRSAAPTSTTRSTSFTPVRVSIAPAPSTAWTTATRCPSATAARAAFGAQTLAQDTNRDVGGTSCVYRIDEQASIDITVIQGTVATNREIWTRPTASVVRDAPELAKGAVIVYTPPDAGVLDQCLVAVDHPDGTLTVQVTRRDHLADRQRLCAPLGPMLRLLAGQ